MRLTNTALGRRWNLDVTQSQSGAVRGTSDDLTRDSPGKPELLRRFETNNSRHVTNRQARLTRLFELRNLCDATLNLTELAVDFCSFLGNRSGYVSDHLASLFNSRVLG